MCGQHHLIEERFCRFISRTFDRIDAGAVVLTQERIANALGVRRTSVTEIAQRLQRDGVISYCRGNMSLIDRRKLGERMCVCADIVKRAFAAVINQV